MTGLRRGLILALAVIILDQLTKQLILTQLVAPIAVTGFFNLVLVWNRGISFGMLGRLGDHGPWLLVGFALIVGIVLLLLLAREQRWLSRLAFGLVLGGAVGNAVDRLRFGAVIDFLDVHALGYHWPAFNVADSAIVVGAGLLVLDGLRSGRAKTNEVQGQGQTQ